MEELNSLGRKEREKLLRKKEIMNAAAILFAGKGFSHTTLEEIAVKAEFGIGTIYNYFQSKEEIYKSIIDSTFDASLEIINRCINSTSSLIEFFNIYTKEIFEYYAKNKEALIIIAGFYTAVGEGPANLRHDTFEAKHSILDDLLFKKIKEGIKNKEIRKVNPEYLYQLYHGLLFPYIANLAFMNKLNESEILQHVNFILDVIFNGILVK
ncbi:MAG: TetR/AcrR family transcriptional regulator [Ignavibacteriales bacterium]|nr:TetR/AcrR family transcriptional regulator [Ignavibacteriales bacterium]